MNRTELNEAMERLGGITNDDALGVVHVLQHAALTDAAVEHIYLRKLRNLCDENDISLIKTEEPEVCGEWNWLKDGRASEGHPTELKCAISAAETFNLI